MRQINFKQLGSTGLQRYSGYICEEFLPSLRWPNAGRVYKEMSDNDATIGAILYLAEMLIRGAEWTVTPASSSEADKAAAEFLESCMYDMDMSWANVISEILSMLTYGFSFHEIVYKIRRGPHEADVKYRSNNTDGRVGWRRMPIRSQVSLKEWIFNEDNDVIAVVQQAAPNYADVTIPMSKGMLFRTRVSNDNPEGKSLLRNAYRSWFFKKHFEEIEGIGIERDLAGFPVLKAPEGLDLWNEDDASMTALRVRAEELVASVRRDSEEGILLPFGWDLSLLSSSSDRQISIGDTIERYDNRIAITMLSDIILIGSTKTGSFALADTKQSMLAAALQSQLDNICDVFNDRAVKDLFRINEKEFTGITGLPKIVASQIQTPSPSELAVLMRSMNLNWAADMELQNYLRKVLGMPVLDKDTFERVYEPQARVDAQEVPTGNGVDPITGHAITDEADKLLEQNDMAYERS